MSFDARQVGRPKPKKKKTPAIGQYHGHYITVRTKKARGQPRYH